MALDWLRKTDTLAAEGELQGVEKATGQDRTTTDFATGMQRSGALKDLAFASIHPIALISLARTLGGEGAPKYGSKNWELGCDVEDTLNHCLYHITMYLAGDRTEPHLDHLLCGAHFAVVNDTLNPHLSKPHLRGPGCTLTPEILAHLEAGKADRRRKREAGEFDHLGEWKLSEVPEVARILAQRAG